MTIDHIGILVPSLQDGLNQWEALFGYRQQTEIVVNSRQRVRVMFLAKQNSLPVKLIQPSGLDSPLYQAARRGGGLHHLCFRCSALAETIPLLEKEGARVLVPPQPGEAFGNHPIAFLWARHHLNFEVIDTSEKAGWRSNGAAECLSDRRAL